MSSNIRYLVFIEKPGVMPDGKTPDPNYLVAYMLNNLPPQIRGSFEHHIIDSSSFHEWKSRIPQLVQTTPQLVDASNGQVIHGIQCVFFMYQTLFRINPSFLLSSISPNLQQLDYQFRSQLMPPQQQQSDGGASASASASASAQAQMMRQNARPPIQSGRAPSSQLPARPNNSNTKNNMMLSSSGRPMQASGGMQHSGMAQGNLKTNFLNPSMIPESVPPVGGDMQSIGYTVHKDLLYYNLPKNAEIPKELETYLVGSENPDLGGGAEGDMLSGIPSSWEDRAGFLGIMETGPTQFDDKSTNLLQDYNDNSEFLDISKMDISNKPVNTGGVKESYDSNSMRELRRGSSRR